MDKTGQGFEESIASARNLLAQIQYLQDKIHLASLQGQVCILHNVDIYRPRLYRPRHYASFDQQKYFVARIGGSDGFNLLLRPPCAFFIHFLFSEQGNRLNSVGNRVRAIDYPKIQLRDFTSKHIQFFFDTVQLTRTRFKLGAFLYLTPQNARVRCLGGPGSRTYSGCTRNFLFDFLWYVNLIPYIRKQNKEEIS